MAIASPLFRVGRCQRRGAPTGRKVDSQGQRPGKYSRNNPSPEGAKLSAGIALSGLGNSTCPNPGALPRAIEFRPSGASDHDVLNPLKTERKLNSPSSVSICVHPWFKRIEPFATALMRSAGETSGTARGTGPGFGKAPRRQISRCGPGGASRRRSSARRADRSRPSRTRS